MTRTITGLSKRREAAIQQRLMAQVERRFEVVTAREISVTMREAAKAGNMVARAVVFMNHRDRMKNILQREWRMAFNVFGGRIIGATSKSRRGMELKLDEVPKTEAFDRAVQAWIQKFGAMKVTEITGTTEEQAQEIIKNATADAIADGLSEAETSKLIQKRMNEQRIGISRLRARIISRTETHGASQAAIQEAGKASGIPSTKKEWSAAGGGRTRDDHRRADGQVRNLNEPFDVGGEQLMYPGDPSGSAEQIINCRCVELLVVD